MRVWLLRSPPDLSAAGKSIIQYITQIDLGHERLNAPGAHNWEDVLRG